MFTNSPPSATNTFRSVLLLTLILYLLLIWFQREVLLRLLRAKHASEARSKDRVRGYSFACHDRSGTSYCTVIHESLHAAGLLFTSCK